jgi:hypothetical protein
VPVNLCDKIKRLVQISLQSVVKFVVLSKLSDLPLHATIHSVVIREVSKQQAASMFRKTIKVVAAGTSQFFIVSAKICEVTGHHSRLSKFGIFFRRDPNYFLSRLVTMDDTWLHHYDSETKQQSMEWRHSGSPRPKKFRVQKSAGKVLGSIFLDEDVVLLID